MVGDVVMGRFRHWLNLGDSDGNIAQYEEELAEDNLQQLRRYVKAGILFILFCIVLRWIANGPLLDEVIPNVIGIIVLAILFHLIVLLQKKKEKITLYSRIYVALFAAVWYVLSLYFSILQAPEHPSVLPCIALLMIPCLFSFVPAECLCIEVIAFACFMVCDSVVANPGMVREDFVYELICLILGLYGGWMRTSGRIQQVRYLNIYRATGVLYERSFYANLKNNHVSLLQGGEEFRELLTECESAEEVLTAIQNDYIAEDFRADYQRFTNLEAMTQRLSFADKAEFEYQDKFGIWHRLTVIGQFDSGDRDGHKTLAGVIAVVQLIHAQKLQEQEYQKFLKDTAADAVHENEEKDNYLRKISYDIRNDVNGIRGIVELSGQYMNDAQRLEENRQHILDATKHLLILLNGVQDINDLNNNNNNNNVRDWEAAAREVDPEIQEIPSIDGVRILLVEDNEINMEIAEFALSEHNAVVTKAWNGEEAVQIFKEAEPGSFDLILMDLMMPRMNGLDATKAIRRMDRSDAKTIPIIAMTANAFLEDREDCLKAGMNDHITKPVSANRLLEKVAEYLHR